MSILSKDKCISIKSFSKNNLPLLQQMIDETEFSDLQQLVGSRVYDALVKECKSGEISEDLKDILEGGLYATITYFTYCNYIQQSGVFDTFSGMVSKEMSDSNPVPVGTIKNLVIHNREIAELHFARIKDKLYSYFGRCSCDSDSSITDDFSEIIGVRDRRKKTNVIRIF